jgi:pimeloyl-ACP methyl ester carboxylesterase
MSANTITLQSGARDIDVLTGGAESGPALVCHHGTPSDATVWRAWDEVARANGLRLIAISRPGYATSTRLPGRSVASVVADVAATLDALDVPWFVTTGWSGGGPHALACAALEKRCRAASTLAGVGPYGRADLDFLAGMGPENHAEFGAALSGEAALRAWFAENAEAMRTVTGAELAAAFGGLVPQVDKDVMAGAFADEMAAEMRRALAGGFDGWVDDDAAFIAEWGFALDAITVPVTIWQGDLDLMVPAAHGAWLARHVPGARARSAPGHGHVSLIPTYRDEIVADLVASARRD